MADSFLDALVNVAPASTPPQSGLELFNKAQGATAMPAAQPASGQGFLEGLAKSTLSAGTKEFIGLPPTAGALEFRGEHPVLGVLSQMAGFGVPFVAGGELIGTAGKAVGAARIVSKLPMAARAAEWLSNPLTQSARPITHAAVTEMIKFAPAEAARLGLSAAVGGNPEAVAEQIPVNLVTVGALGGLFKGLSPVFKGGSLSGGISPGAKGGFQPTNEYEGIITRYLPKGPEGYDVLEAPQLRYRRLIMLRNAIEKDPETYPKELGEAIRDVIEGAKREGTVAFPGLKNQILLESPAGTYKPVRPFEFPGVDHRQVAPWFTVGSAKGRTIRYLKDGIPNGFKFGDDLFKRFRSALPPDAEADMLLPRAITFDTQEASKGFRKIVNSMNPITTNAWMVPEQDGFYVIAQKVRGKSWPIDPKTKLPMQIKNVKGTMSAHENDAWLLFKTDRPETFFPERSLQNRVLEKEIWGVHKEGIKEAPPRIINFGDTIKTKMWSDVLQREISYTDIQQGRFLAGLEKQMPGEQSLAGIGPTERVRVLSQAIVRDPETRATLSGLGHTAEDAAKRLLAPLTAQFSKAPYLQRVLTAATALVSRGTKIANDAWRGEAVIPKGTSAMRGMLRVKTPFQPGTPAAIFNDITLEELDQIKWIRGLGHSLEEVKAMPDVSPRVKRFMEVYQKNAAPALRDYNLIHILEGKEMLPARPEHFGIATVEGGQKLPVLASEDFIDPATKQVVFKKDSIINIVGGWRPAEAKSRADELVKILGKYGIKAYTRSQDINRDIALRGLLEEAQHATSVMKSITHLKVGEDSIEPELRKFFAGARISKSQYETNILDSLRELTTTTGRVLHQHRFDYDFAFAARRWPGLTMQARDRVDKIFGSQGTFSRRVNEELDKVFGPVFGKNSASKAALAVNRMMMPLTLGWFDIGYPITNAVGTLMTMAPELAYIKAAGKDLGKQYDWELVVKNGEARPFGNLSVLGMMKLGFKDLFDNKDPLLHERVTRSVQEGLTHPNFIEEYMGKEFGHILDIKKIFSGEQTLTGWAGSVLTFLPAKSEQFARLFAFTTGLRAAAIGGLEDEAAYQFAAKFVRRTMYDYSTYARPQLLTGPIGTPLGLFKVWSYNYLANLGTYTGAAFKGNFGPLAWGMASTGLVAGATGMPFWFMADNMAKLAGDKSAMEFLYKNSGYAQNPGVQPFVDAFAYGFPTFLGVSLTSRAGAPSSDPMRDLDLLTSIAALDRFSYLGQAIGDGWAAFTETGTHPGNFRPAREKLWRAVMPRTGYRIIQAVANRGMRSLATGNQLLPEMTVGTRAMYALGLTPLDVQKNYDAMTELTKARDKQQKLVQLYGDMATTAMEDSDWKGLHAIIKQAFLDGVNPKSIVSSMQARYAKRNEPAIDRSFKADQVMYAKRLYGLK